MILQKPTITYPDYKKFTNFLDNQYKNEKEEINSVTFFYPSNDKVAEKFNWDEYVSSFYRGRAITLPEFRILDDSIEQYDSFESFTSEKEVENISLWLLAALRFFFSTEEVRLGKEIEILQSNNPRDGRLDVVSLKSGKVTIFETKTDLKKALSEARFDIQIRNYGEEAKKIAGDRFSVDAFVVLGGEETDLFPPQHIDCTTGKVGNISKLFYEKILKKNIKFISANSIWCLMAYSIVKGVDLDLENILTQITENPTKLGLLSGGVVTLSGGEIKLTEINI